MGKIQWRQILPVKQQGTWGRGCGTSDQAHDKALPALHYHCNQLSSFYFCLLSHSHHFCFHLQQNSLAVLQLSIHQGFLYWIPGGRIAQWYGMMIVTHLAGKTKKTVMIIYLKWAPRFWEIACSLYDDIERLSRVHYWKLRKLSWVMITYLKRIPRF